MDSVLRALVDLRQQVQKTRVAFGNRLNAVASGMDGRENGRQHETLSRWYNRFKEIEDGLDDEISEVVQDNPIYAHLSMVKGIGPLIAAQLIALIDITRSDTVSQLWRFAGLAVIDGKRERPVKGERLHYSKRLKTLICYQVASGLLRANSPYRKLYDEARHHYEITHPEWTNGHVHRAAIRKMVKPFLAHFWERWRVLEGLPIRKLYVHEVLGHTHLWKMEDFGWPTLESMRVSVDDYDDDLAYE